MDFDARMIAGLSSAVVGVVWFLYFLFVELYDDYT